MLKLGKLVKLTACPAAGHGCEAKSPMVTGLADQKTKTLFIRFRIIIEEILVQ